MSSEFLSFKGVKHYSPEQGWGQLSSALHQLQERVEPHGDLHALIPVLKDEFSQEIKMPAMPPTALPDEWRVVAAQVSQLSDCMSAQKLYQERLQALETNIAKLRESIKSNLESMAQKMVTK